MTKALKIVLISLPIIGAGGFYYWWYKKYAIPTKKAVPVIGGNGPVGKTQTSASAASTTSGCTYPLQQGSKNTCVGQLQDALGVTIDNNFGKQTYDALLEQAGVTYISSLVQLNQIIDSILSNDEGSFVINSNLSNSILSNYQNSANVSLAIGVGTFKYLQAINYTVFRQVSQYSDGSWYSAGYQLPLTKGKNIPLSTYQPVSVDPETGNLILNCISGSNQGYWSANPNDLLLS